MRKFILLFANLIFILGSLNVAASNFDIYGVDPKLQRKILSVCKKDIQEYERLSQQIKLSVTLEQLIIERHEFEKSIIKKTNALGDFSFANISTIIYPENQASYSTLDLVQKIDLNRMPNSAERTIKKITNKSEGLKKLFLVWNNYFERSVELMRHNKFDMKGRSCPVVHCAWGFDKIELKHDLPKLKEGALKYKKQLLEIIKYSQNDEERGQAILILGNTIDYSELGNLMITLIDDPSDMVRNNSMRVLGAILSKHVIPGFDIHRILLALNYPYVTDRNKAAYVLLDLVRQDKSTYPVVIKDGGDTLMNLLKLKQPNNHDLAYLILKEISHQNYSEHDYQRWQNWLDLQNGKLKSA